MLPELLNLFGLFQPVSTVIEFGIVLLAAGKIYDVAQTYFVKK